MNNLSYNDAGNGPFQRISSHGLMTNISAANNATTNFVGGSDVLMASSNITYDVSQVDKMIAQMKLNEREQIANFQENQLMNKTGSPT